MSAVAIASNRLVHAARGFVGRPATMALALLPSLFALCGTAQALTGLNAAETASGIRVDEPTLAARRMLVLAETVSEHGLAIARDWPILAGGDADLALAKRFKASMAVVRPALYPTGDVFLTGGGRMVPDAAAIAAALAEGNAALDQALGEPADRVLTEAASFAAWLERRPTASAALLAAADPEFGARALLPMPEGGPADCAARLAADETYAARPDGQGLVYETGVLPRTLSTRLIHQLMEAHGPGLRTRLAARLVDLRESLQRLGRLAQDLVERDATPEPLGTGGALAGTEAARGWLAHRIELENGMVRDYRILAPTEWNFHPQGPLARALVGEPAGAGLEAKARLLVQALDPCVACSLTVA